MPVQPERQELESARSLCDGGSIIVNCAPNPRKKQENKAHEVDRFYNTFGKMGVRSSRSGRVTVARAADSRCCSNAHSPALLVSKIDLK